MSKAPNADWLERANRLALTSALLSTTVHEVNNALQVISGSAEMLNTSPPADVTGRRTDAIGAHARRASALLAELSAFARDESTAPMVLDLAQIGQRALSLRQYSLAKLKIESVFETAGDPRTVVAHQRMLLQIVLNLVVNAEQALTKKGFGRIGLSVRGESGRVTLAVDDDGPGVAADIVPGLFTPSMCATDGRLGIGLAVAKQLAERYGGTVEYHPRIPVGARFTVALPVSQ
jgi:two-component system C4-dicarboxylate transport sensor histidine kinase DctB